MFLIPTVTVAPTGLLQAAVDPACLRVIEDQLFKTVLSPDEVAGIVFEPIQGEGGYIVPPPEFFEELKRISKRHGILLIADEVQSGMGRTGKMFAVEHFGVEPDIIAIAKGIASGLPLGAIVARAELMSWPPGSHASTFGGNPISCAAALETIRLIEDELMQNAAEVGEHLLQSLRKLMTRCSAIGDVRGLGLMIGIELVKDKTTKEKAVAWRDLAVQRCFERGLLILGCGENTLRLMPPLIVSRAQADAAMEILEDVLSEIGGKQYRIARTSRFSGGLRLTAQTPNLRLPGVRSSLHDFESLQLGWTPMPWAALNQLYSRLISSLKSPTGSARRPMENSSTERKALPVNSAPIATSVSTVTRSSRGTIESASAKWILSVGMVTLWRSSR